MKTKPEFSIVETDAIGLMKQIPSGTVDLIFTDPPYESLEKYRSIGTTTRLKHSKASSNNWFSIFPNTRFAEFFEQAFRVLKRNAHLYFMCDAETMFVAKPAAEAAGFRFWKPVVWDKMKIGMGYHYRARYEFILFFEKGKRKLNDLGVPDVLQVPRVYNGYPTEKPAALTKVFVEQSTRPGDLVLDPFMGSGSTGAAALAGDRRFLGADICAEAIEVTRERLCSLGIETGFQGDLVQPSHPSQMTLLASSGM